MLSLSKLAAISRSRIKNQLANQKNANNSDFSGMYISETAPYHERLVKSCHQDRFDIDELFLMALPEKLLSKIALLAIGPMRAGTQKTPDYPEFDTAELNHLKDLLMGDAEFEYNNLKALNRPICISNILICHGLSPIGDSLALVAELGRTFRMSVAMNLPIHVMIADISWMSSNRSIQQISSLGHIEIDNGLRICLDKRLRIYKTLGFEQALKEISMYPRPNAIDGKRLRKISLNYKNLAVALWGEKASSKLEIETIKLIDKPMQSIEGIKQLDNTGIPEHMKAFAKFPKVLHAFDQHLKEHLEILRTVAKQFSSFDEEIFTYFFAQYYAQEGYKSSYLKIAPHSELKFDKPFDDLRKCFMAWDDYDQVALHAEPESVGDKLPGLYLPQYKVGSFKVLPYSPLSLDVLKKGITDHRLLGSEIILLSEIQPIEVIEAILKKTDLVNRNRLIADTISFIQMCIIKTDYDMIDGVCKELEYGSFAMVLNSIHEKLLPDFKMEIAAIKDQKLVDIWRSWFKNIEDDDSIYTPLHIFLSLFSQSEWDQPRILSGFAKIVMIVKRTYQTLT